MSTDVDAEASAYGTAMRALPNDRWRAAVLAYVGGGGGNKGRTDKGYSTALKAAGWEGTDGAIKVAAHRFFHDQRVQAAIVEVAKAHMLHALPLALAAQEEILSDPQHKDRATILKSVMDRTGLHAVTEEKVTHEVEISADSIEEAKRIAQRLGVTLASLLGRRIAARVMPAAVPQVEHTPVLDAEFDEVPQDLKDIF